MRLDNLKTPFQRIGPRVSYINKATVISITITHAVMYAVILNTKYYH